AGGKGADVEAGDWTDAAAPFQDRRPGRLQGATHRRNNPQSGHHYPASRHGLTSKRMERGSFRALPPPAARRGLRRKPGSGFGPVLVDVVNGLLDGGDLLGVLVRDLRLELFLERHHELNGIERVGTEVVDERRVVG